jgi:predicted MFS family arabinose efflux permease
MPAPVLRTYLAVLRSPGVPVPAAGAAIASLPIGMLGLGLLLLVRERTGDLAAAGVVVAALGVGTCAGMVAQGLLIDRFGPRPVLPAVAALRALTSVGLVVAATTGGPVGVVAGLAAVVGASEPQVASALRGLWPQLVEPALHPAASALSALLFELPVLAGPLLVTGIALVGPVEWVVLVAAAFAVAGTGLFVASAPARRWRAVAPRPRRTPGTPAVPAVVVSVGVTAVQALAIGVLQVGAVAVATRQGGAPGPLFALLTAGSLIGATWCGPRMRAASRRPTPVLLVALAALLVAAAVLPGLPALAACMFLFGLGAGPLGVRCFLDLQTHAPAGSLTTAVTAQVAAGLAATSAGSALAGWSTGAGDTASPLLLAAGVAALTAVAVARVQRSQPTPVRKR